MAYFSDYLKMNESRSKGNELKAVDISEELKNSRPATFKYLYCGNERMASRFYDDDDDTIEVRTVKAKSDKEAIIKIMLDIEFLLSEDEDELRNNIEETFDVSFDDVTADRMLDFLGQIDVDSGDPFVFWIKKNNAEIFDMGLDPDEWNEDPL